LDLSNPTLPEITDGYEIQLHHALGRDQVALLKHAGRSSVGDLIIHVEMPETACWRRKKR